MQNKLLQMHMTHRALAQNSAKTESCNVAVVLVCQASGCSVSEDNLWQVTQPFVLVTMLSALRQNVS